MVKIISFGSEKDPSNEFFPKKILGALWGIFSAQDTFTKFFIIIALIIAVVSPIFIARFFTSAVSNPSLNYEPEKAGLSGPVHLGTDNTVSGGQFIQFDHYQFIAPSEQCPTVPPDGAGVVLGEISVQKEGVYFIWSRVMGSGDSGNSYYLQIDNGCLISIRDNASDPADAWNWVNYQNGDPSSIVFSTLASGIHSVKLIGKEGGVSVDRLLFLSDSNCTPSELGDNCLQSQPVQPASQQSETTKTASILVEPFSGNYNLGSSFSLDLKIDGGGTAFNAAQAQIKVTNIQIESLTVIPPESGGCNFTWANQNKTPKISDPSFAGAILKSSSLGCTVYTLTVKGISEGAGSLEITRGSVKDFAAHSEILGTLKSGSYTFSIAPTSTPVPPTSTPTSTPAPTFTPTPTPEPTSTPTPTPIPTNTPVPPTSTPTPMVLQAPTIDPQSSPTYKTTLTLSGTKMAELTEIFVNDSSAGVSYPTLTSWQSPVNLITGPNVFVIYGRDGNGSQSPQNSISIENHLLSDINGDAIVDLTDLSMFGTDYENTGTLNYPLSEMSNDALVDLTDFSIIAKQYNGTL